MEETSYFFSTLSINLCAMLLIVSFVSLMRLGFTFGLHPNWLIILYNDNLFGHAIVEGDSIALDLNYSYNKISSAFI